MQKIQALDHLLDDIFRLRSIDCLVINIAGGVAVGKTTLANQIAIELIDMGINTVVCSTDNFLYPNFTLAQKDQLSLKGWPATYDWSSMLEFIQNCKFKYKTNYSLPFYCHESYDIIHGNYLHFTQPEILIIEGVVALNKKMIPHMDLGIYLEVPAAIAKEWFAQRCLRMIKLAIGNQDSFYHKWSCWDFEQVMPVIDDYWNNINLRNLQENILQTKSFADFVIEKDINHQIVSCVAEVVNA